LFEKATVIFPGTTDGKLNIGRILDAMLYYQSVEFIVDGRSFNHLWKRLGPDATLRLLCHPSLDCKITPEIPVIYNENCNGVIAHRPVQMSHAGRDKFIIDNKDTASKLAFGLGEDEFRLNRPRVNKIVKKVKTTRFAKLFEKLPVQGDLFLDLISDVDTLRLFLRGYAIEKKVHCNEALLASLETKVYQTPKGYVISANIPPGAIVRGHFEDGWQQLLPMIFDYQLDLRMASTRSADIISGDVNSLISAQRLDVSMNRAKLSADQQSSFEQFAFTEARPFGEAFENGQISLSEALKVIDETSKFREWLGGMPVDSDLVREFHQAVNRDTILTKLPGRTSRFAVFTGGGVLLDILATGGMATPVAVGLSAFDALVLDSVAKGWQPNHFVEKVRSAIEK
jgi:hypothetical protein